MIDKKNLKSSLKIYWQAQKNWISKPDPDKSENEIMNFEKNVFVGLDHVSHASELSKKLK